MRENRYVLTETEGYKVFEQAGIPTPKYDVFSRGADAGSFVEKINKAGDKKFVVKVVSPDVFVVSCFFLVNRFSTRLMLVVSSLTSLLLIRLRRLSMRCTRSSLL